MDGDGMVSLAVRRATERRKRKPSTKMGRGRVTRPRHGEIGTREEHLARFPVKVTGRVLPSLDSPPSWSRKSMCQAFRRVSPSVMPRRPTPSCSATASRMRRVLRGAEGVGGDATGLALEAQRLERGRTQEAAHMIGAERRPRVRHGGHPGTTDQRAGLSTAA